MIRNPEVVSVIIIGPCSRHEREGSAATSPKPNRTDRGNM